MRGPTNEEVSVILIYKSSKVLLQEARLKPPAKTLLMQYYSKRLQREINMSNRGKLKVVAM